MGEFFSVACAAVWAFAVILLRRSGETLPAFELNLVKNLLGLALMVPTVLLTEGFSLPGYTAGELSLVLVSGIVGIAVADTWYLRALNLMGAGRTGVVASLYSPFVIVLSMLFLGESLRAWQLAGFGLVLAGILLVTWRTNRRDVSARALRTGVAFGAGAVLMMAVGVVMVKPVLEGDDFFWTVLLRLAGGAAAMLIFVWATRGASMMMAHYRRPQPWPMILVAGFLATYLSMMLWLAGYRLTSASVAAVLNETAAAFIVLFAWWLLGEGMSRRRIAGVALTFSGVVVILSV
ncbi:MAG: DMT family transporter [Wenzhouxiangellaceae bacterium]|nr:DMT family transporter [Wenzhouxiangellaceae bacterium]